jgi:hypothetical protein
MVKRAGRQVVTVEIFKDTYDSLKKSAEERRNTTKEFVNTMLINSLLRLHYLIEIAPELSIDSYEDNRITLKDSKARRLIDVYQKDKEFFCDLDKKLDCIHSKFVWSSPEVSLERLLYELRSRHAHGNKTNVSSSGGRRNITTTTIEPSHILTSPE